MYTKGWKYEGYSWDYFSYLKIFQSCISFGLGNPIWIFSILPVNWKILCRILINLRLNNFTYYALGQFQLAQKYNKPINKICGIQLTNISWRKYSPDISHIVEISNISLHKYTQKMQHKNVLFIQEFSNWQFKHVQVLDYTVYHTAIIFSLFGYLTTMN